MDQLPSPLMDSEAKRTSVKVTKQLTAPTVEGTSVAPRQRPKGGQPLPVGGVLPIPSSIQPSLAPRRVPVVQPTNGACPTGSDGQPPSMAPHQSSVPIVFPSQTSQTQLFFPPPGAFDPRSPSNQPNNPSSVVSSVPNSVLHSQTPVMKTSDTNGKESLEALFPASGN